MAVVYGQIDSLKQIRAKLNEEGISRFNSTGDIQKFITNFDLHKEELFYNVQHKYHLKLEKLQEQETELRSQYTELKSRLESQFTGKIEGLKQKCEKASSVTSNNPIVEVLYWYKYIILKAVLFIYQRRFQHVMKSGTKEKFDELKAFEQTVESFKNNLHRFISNRFEDELDALENERKVAKELNPLIAGAIGERMVADELETLPEPCVVFNDYQLHFKKPIYNRKENDRIYSVQIDHLLVTKAGVFIIEAKNWSKKSIASLDLRSPVKQMKRASYALFVLLNGKHSRLNGSLNNHHWGEKELPVKNIVAMIHNRPKDKFKHVAVKNLDELKGYITYFNPLFDDSEVQGIAKYLKGLEDYYS